MADYITRQDTTGERQGGAATGFERAGRLGDGYHSSAIDAEKYATFVPVIRAAAEAAGRPMPTLSARVRVHHGATTDRSFPLRGSPEEIAEEIRAFEKLGVEHLALAFPAATVDAMVLAAEQFAEEAALLVD